MKTMIDYKKIKEQIPHGGQTEIAKIANVSINTVHLVLNGRSTNADVINAIADYLTAFKAKQETAESRLASLID